MNMNRPKPKPRVHSEEFYKEAGLKVSILVAMISEGYNLEEVSQCVDILYKQIEDTVRA